MADAYATWWSESNLQPGGYTDPEAFKAGAPEAKQRAIQLYQDYLKSQRAPSENVRNRLKALQENRQGSKEYRYFCEGYED